MRDNCLSARMARARHHWRRKQACAVARAARHRSVHIKDQAQRAAQEAEWEAVIELLAVCNWLSFAEDLSHLSPGTSARGQDVVGAVTDSLPGVLGVLRAEG
jgi:hypothetical protein